MACESCARVPLNIKSRKKKRKRKNTSPFIGRKGNSVDHFPSIFLLADFFLLFPLFLSSLTLSKYFIDQRVTVLGKFCFMHLLISLGENELRGVMELGEKVSVHVGRARVISCVMDME